MYLYETHMHTRPSSACAVSSPEEMVRHYKSKDYSGVIVTDHFFNGNSGCPQDAPWADKVRFYMEAYERAKAEGEKCDLDVFFGLESSYNGSDFLVYGLDEEFLLENKDFDKLSLNEFSAAVRGAGAYLAQAHPFRSAFWIANPEPAHPSLIDGIEVHNASMDAKTNRLALEFAEKHNLPKQAGSDAHDAYAKKPSGIALQKRAVDIFDIISAIKSGSVVLITN
ncbi:MAG: PHP domain-containing protein [Defluviitaleaceae bacterium]|nr:PHP domain-containing protein [Defluviitaleaceae bacterium]MCL2264160.1 PHP domain-containing protein [Defluviitaleaceae bacterium]